MAGRTYRERNADAQARGWDSLYYETRARREARDTFAEHNKVPSPQEVTDYSLLLRDFDRFDWTGRGPELRAMFASYFPEEASNDAAYHRWVRSLYQRNT